MVVLKGAWGGVGVGRSQPVGVSSRRVRGFPLKFRLTILVVIAENIITDTKTV